MEKLNELKFIEYRFDDKIEWDNLMQKLNDIEMDNCEYGNDEFHIQNIGNIDGINGDMNTTLYIDFYNGNIIGYSIYDGDFGFIAISDKMQKIIDNWRK